MPGKGREAAMQKGAPSLHGPRDVSEITASLSVRSARKAKSDCLRLAPRRGQATSCAMRHCMLYHEMLEPAPGPLQAKAPSNAVHLIADDSADEDLPGGQQCSIAVEDKNLELPPVPKSGPESLVDSQLLMIELCAGSAILSRCFADVGFKTLPVNHNTNRFHTQTRVCNLDLTQASSWRYLEWVCEALFMGDLPVAAARLRPGGPPPLRSPAWPWIFPDLQGQDRLGKCNYKRMTEFIQFLESQDIA